MKDLRYKYTSYSQSEKDCLLADLKRVGPKKPLGYLPLSVFYEITSNVKDFLSRLTIKGLGIIELDENESNILSGAIFVYDRSSLEKLLNKHNQTLKSQSWPLDTNGFIRCLKNGARKESELNRLINCAFGIEPQ